jgi:hypothetical protein
MDSSEAIAGVKKIRDVIIAIVFLNVVIFIVPN